MSILVAGSSLDRLESIREASAERSRFADEAKIDLDSSLGALARHKRNVANALSTDAPSRVTAGSRWPIVASGRDSIER